MTITNVTTVAYLSEVAPSGHRARSPLLGEGYGWRMARANTEPVEPPRADRCRERAEALLASDFVGCLSEAPSDLAADHRRYLIESFGSQRGES